MANLNQPAPIRTKMTGDDGLAERIWAKWFEAVRIIANTKLDPASDPIENNIVIFAEEGAIQDSGVDISAIIVLDNVEISENYTILDDDEYLHLQVTTGASDITITLPTLADNENRVFYITKVDSGSGDVIIAAEGTETITGEASRTIAFQYTTAQVKAGSNQWLLI